MARACEADMLTAEGSMRAACACVHLCLSCYVGRGERSGGDCEEAFTKLRNKIGTSPTCTLARRQQHLHPALNTPRRSFVQQRLLLVLTTFMHQCWRHDFSVVRQRQSAADRGLCNNNHNARHTRSNGLLFMSMTSSLCRNNFSGPPSRLFFQRPITYPGLQGVESESCNHSTSFLSGCTNRLPRPLSG